MATAPSSALVEAPEHFIQEAKEANDQELHRATPPALAMLARTFGLGHMLTWSSQLFLNIWP